jgi:hypothetical protein
MAHNTASLQRGKLTIKYAPRYPISETQAHKLSRSLDLACENLRAALRLLAPICGGNKLDAGADMQTVLEILDCHFFQNSPINRGSKESFWRRDVVNIALNLRRLLCELSGSVTIADAYASIVLGAVDKEKEAIRNEGRTHAELGIKWDITLEQYAGRLNRARSAGDDIAMDGRGYVAPKKSTTQALKASNQTRKFVTGAIATPVGPAERLLAAGVPGNRVPDWMKPKAPAPEVKLTPDQLGSIHINFKRMLRTVEPLSDSMVARTIIHEASHKFIATHDHAYAGEDKYERLDRREALLNADSYAFAVVSLARNRNFKDDLAMKWADAGFDF